MKIAVLTMFNGLSTTYSLVNVVADQLKMLLNANYEVSVLVSEHCNDNERFGIFANEKLNWVKITNTLNNAPIIWRDYANSTGNLHKSFYDEVDVIAKDFVKHLQDVDVCIMHDILYQGWHFVHNMAIRKAQKQLPRLRFLSFTHSMPVNRPQIIEKPFDARYYPMENTIFVYPTNSGLEALSWQYNVDVSKCKAVYNAISLLQHLGEDVNNLAQKVDLLSPDYLIIYPARLTTAKKFEKIAMVAGALKTKTQKNVTVIFCDFPCADIESNTYKSIIKNAAVASGLLENDVYFTSDLGYPKGFPRKGVLDLFSLSNLFICPSFAESFGLTVLEAASKGNFLVLNEAVPALEEIGKTLNAYFLRWDARNFGFDTHEEYHPSETAYYLEHAQIIANLMENDKSILSKTKVRINYNLKSIFENQLLPLLENN